MPLLKRHTKLNIDKEMKTVVRELNKLGLHTTSSCAGHKDPRKNTHTKSQLAFESKDVTVLLDKGIVSINWDRFI
jgi:hypothetical protein